MTLAKNQRELDKILNDPKASDGRRVRLAPGQRFSLSHGAGSEIELGEGTSLYVEEGAGPVSVVSEKGHYVSCKSSLASLKLGGDTIADVDDADAVRLRGQARAIVEKAHTVVTSDMATVSAEYVERIDVDGQSSVAVRGESFVAARDGALVQVQDAAWACVQAYGNARVNLSRGSVCYAYDSSVVAADGGKVIASDGSTVLVRDPSSTVDAMGRAVVYEPVKADVHLSGWARSTEPFRGPDGDLDSWVRWTGAQVDGDDVLLYAPAGGVPLSDDGPVLTWSVVMYATLADAARESEPGNLFVLLRVARKNVTSVWADGIFASEAEVESVVDLRGEEIQRD